VQSTGSELLAAGIAALVLLAAPAAARAAAPTGDFTVSPQVPVAGANATFSASANDADGDPITVSWSFGDGGSATGDSVPYAYATGGTKTVTMTLEANGDTFTKSHAVRVDAPPLATFSWSPPVQQIGQPFTFDASGSSDDVAVSSYLWDFGDGQQASGATAQHVYAASGTKTVTLAVTDDDGVTSTAQQVVRVNAPPTAHFTFAALERVAGEPFDVPLLGKPVAFDGRSSSDTDGSIATYEWDFNGDGQFGDDTRSSLITNLSTPGVVNIGLRVTDSDGAQSVFTQPVRVDQAPLASFTFTPTSPVAGQRVTFDSTSMDPDGAQDITALRWDLDADNTYGDATGPTATRVFAVAGTYPVGLQVVDSAGVQVVELQHVSVRILGAPGLAGAPFSSTFVSTPMQRMSSGASSVLVNGVKRTLSVIPGIRVAIAGRVFEGATKITRLVVHAPAGALVATRCRGHGCPAKRDRHRVRSAGSVRLHRLERSLAAGAHVTVTVTRKGFIGKQIQFTIRQAQPPVRHELCLVPGARRATKCPAA
jgi:PKD repeat protein